MKRENGPVLEGEGMGKVFSLLNVPDSDMDGDEDMLHADEVVDAPDAVV